MDAYTEPASNTYRLMSLFTATSNGKGYRAFSIQNSQLPYLVAVFTILILILFNAIWKTFRTIILAFFPPISRTQMVGMAGFWNANSPSDAAYTMLTYIFAIRRRGQQQGNRRLGIVAFVTASITAIASLVMGIIYTNLMTLGNVAPVDPNAVFLPYVEDVTDATTSKLDTWYGPAALRAMGSAEAFDLHSERSKISVVRKTVEGSNETHPQSLINYSYNISASDFGLQSPLDLNYHVVGSCQTEYSWLWPSSNASNIGLLEEYHLWNLPEVAIMVPGPLSSYSQLDFYADLKPSTLFSDRNKSYALLAKTSHVASYTSSSDPWFLTEAVNSTTDLQVGYRVKAGRPALSCWEDDNFCIDGKCTGPLINDSHVPSGLALILGTRTSSPMAAQLGVMGGVSVLKSYMGSENGFFVDAASASLEAEVRRLVLASFLYGKTVLRDTAMMSRPPGVLNWLDNGQGGLEDGAANFVLQAGSVQAIRFDMFLLIPILLLIFITINTIISLLRRRASFNHNVNHRWTKFKLNALLYQATHIFRMLDERSGPEWSLKSVTMPLPPPNDTRMVPQLRYGKHDWRSSYFNFDSNSGSGITMQQETDHDEEIPLQVSHAVATKR